MKTRSKKGMVLIGVLVAVGILVMMSSTPLLAQKKVRLTSIPGPAGERLIADAKAYMKKHPGVEIIVDIAGGAEEVYKPTFPQIAGSSDRPDMAWYWVDGRQYQAMAGAGFLVPLDDLYAKEGWNKALPQASLNKYTQPDGHRYAVNVDIVWYPQVYYNRKIFAEVGLLAPSTPYAAYSTLEEWYTLIDKIRSAGYEPVTYGGREGWIIGHNHDTLFQRIIPEELRNDLYNNWRSGWKPKTRYTDKEWLEVDKMLLEWYQRGVFAEGYLGRSYPEGRTLFVQEQAAMYQDGSWGVGILRKEAPGLDFGWMLYPKIKKEIDPQFLLYAGNGVMILKGPKHLDVCKDFLAFVMSKERHIALVESEVALVPSRIDIPLEVMRKGLDPVEFDMWQNLDKIGTATGWDDPVPADLAERSFTLFQEMLTGARSPESVGKELEKIAERHRGGR